MEPALTDFESHVLEALVDGYGAREGLKDRIRALNEYEIARRSGFTEISYAAYFEHPTRERVAEALGALQRHGLVTVWERGARYDTFVPTARGTSLVISSRGGEALSVPHEAGESPQAAATAVPASDPIVERLDEIIRLLRALEAELRRR